MSVQAAAGMTSPRGVRDRYPLFILYYVVGVFGNDDGDVRRSKKSGQDDSFLGGISRLAGHLFGVATRLKYVVFLMKNSSL